MPSVRPERSYAMRLQPMSSYVKKKQTNKQTKKQNFHKHLSSTVEESLKDRPEIPNPVDLERFSVINLNVDSVINCAIFICGGNGKNKLHWCKTSRIVTVARFTNHDQSCLATKSGCYRLLKVASESIGKLIYCKTGFNVGGKTGKITFQGFSNRLQE